MPWWGWSVIGIVCIFICVMLYALLCASGEYNRKCEEDEYQRILEQKRKEKENHES